MSIPRTVHVALGLVERNGRYLICQRPLDKFLGGYWEFPGGKCEPTESWETCLRRELHEELGISLRGVRRIGRMRYGYGTLVIDFMILRTTLVGSPKSLEGQRLRWVFPRQLRRYRFPPANRTLIARLSRT